MNPATVNDAALTEAIARVHAARGYQELFGIADPVGEYRRLARILHPDLVHSADPAERAAAADAFVALTTRWRAGREPVVLRAGRAEYRMGRLVYRGDLADLYDAGGDRLVKLPRDPVNNDLLVREAAALRQIAALGDPRYLPYVPRLVDTFTHHDTATGARRRVNVVATAPGLHSLADVQRAYPNGVDPRDVAWIWRRLLVVLGLAHRAGVVHGAVVTAHVLIEPAERGLVLVDWCYATTRPGERVPALVPAYRDAYPPEVLDREPPGPGTDLAMAATCMATLAAGQLPRALRAFAGGCRQPSLQHRPDDAWRLLEELDEVLERLYGPRTFRPFDIRPSNS